jgi:pyruvate dehydrogenase E2 component (dihydrolipoamide acetyltransferase)
MVESATTIPHFYATAAVQIDKLAQLRTSLKPLPQYEGLTFNHLIVKAAGLALRAVSRINSAYVDGQLVNPGAVNIGIVTAVPDGLLIPVLKGADTLHLADIVGEARGLVQRARSGRPKADDLSGGTFSISNMGMFGVESFSAIISPGQGAILAVAPIQQEPVIADGQIRVGSVMRLTLSVDHRIIDGVVAGEFLTEIKRLLEDPVLLLA